MSSCLAPGIVRNVVYITSSDGSVTFTWKAPINLVDVHILYVVKYGGTTLRTVENTITIPTQDKTYAGWVGYIF